ncbi:hypothetical protein H0A71_19010 [Alcaligenaceae bacterium]|nr:hypothetical protein [Alcaligenaceae bacterium]
MSGKHVLQRFQEEVLRSGPEATLPSNLSDYWLAEIQQNIERCFDGEQDPEDAESESYLSLPLAAVMHILFAKNSDEEFTVPIEAMLKNIEDYRIELALEEIRRKTNIKAEPATIASIFTDRDVMV